MLSFITTFLVFALVSVHAEGGTGNPQISFYSDDNCQTPVVSYYWNDLAPPAGSTSEVGQCTYLPESIVMYKITDGGENCPRTEEGFYSVFSIYNTTGACGDDCGPGQPCPSFINTACSQNAGCMECATYKTDEYTACQSVQAGEVLVNDESGGE